MSRFPLGRRHRAAYSVRSEPFDSVYRHPTDGDLPAVYLGRHGSRHAILIPAHGARGREMRYVTDAEISPVIPGGEHGSPALR